MHQGSIVEDGPSAEVMGAPRTPELKSFLSAVLT
jgi:ABC-type histidine transport system ATPase subunit